MAGAFLFTIIIMVLLNFAAGAKPTLYEVLKVPRTATSAQIMMSYEKIMSDLYFSFFLPGNKNFYGNTKLVRQVSLKLTHARDVLLDPVQRKSYNKFLDISILKKKIGLGVVSTGILAGIAGTTYGATKLIQRRFFDPCGKCTRGEIKKHGKPAQACKLQMDTCRNYFDNVYNQCKDQCTREKVNAPMHGFLYKLYKKDAKVKFTQIENATTNADLEGPRQFAQEVKTLEDNGVGNRFGSKLSTKINKAIQRKQDSLN